MDGTRNNGSLRQGNGRTGCVGICDDGFGEISPIYARRLVADFLQELFTRKDPFYPISGTGPIVLRILKGPPDRPSPENTYFRLTDEWWGMCSRCWSYKPSSRPTMLQVAERIEQIVRSILVT